MTDMTAYTAPEGTPFPAGSPEIPPAPWRPLQPEESGVGDGMLMVWGRRPEEYLSEGAADAYRALMERMRERFPHASFTLAPVGEYRTPEEQRAAADAWYLDVTRARWTDDGPELTDRGRIFGNARWPLYVQAVDEAAERAAFPGQLIRAIRAGMSPMAIHNTLAAVDMTPDEVGLVRNAIAAAYRAGHLTWADSGELVDLARSRATVAG
jgi:hypothetical protein